MIDLLKIAVESPASQDWFELYQMLMIMDQVMPKHPVKKDKPYSGIIVEIGVDGGGGLTSYRKAFPHALVIGIDNNMEKVDELKKHNMIFGDTTDPATKQQLVDQLAGDQIDFLFIDGDHVYETVKSDWENFKGLVRPGGAVGFHDTSRMGEGWASKVEVRKLLDEIWKSESYRCAEFWNGRANPGVAIIWP